MSEIKNEIEGSNADLIYQVRNHVYFYTEIDGKSQLLLEKAIEAAGAYMDYSANGKTSTFPVYLHINSPGGYVTCSLALYDFIHARNVVGIVEGEASSGASLLLLACKVRTMTDNSVVMFHQLSGGFSGPYKGIKDNASNVDMLMNKMKSIYVKNTTINTSEIDDILLHDLFWDKGECLKRGIITEEEI